ncbi:MAG: hypothetical protein N3E51_00970 [Candidatus Micrarchaeota archaeon]|nr:hypothetical protein [Candidatus Micrarchaeota archaeon]
MPQKPHDLPFSARYCLPAQVSENLGEVSWETVVQLSADFQISIGEKRGKLRRLLKELQMSRLLLMDRIRQASREGRIDPKLLVDTVKLIQKCEKIAAEYDLDLADFANFLYLVSEKLKKEKLAFHRGRRLLCLQAVPIKEEIDSFKQKSEGICRRKPKRSLRGRKMG